MNYGTDRSEVICRTYVRKTLISEKVAYNLEDAKQVLDCAESLHPCRGAGRAKDFTYDVLTKKLEPQISHSDGLVFSVTCKGAVKQQDFLSIGENTFMFRTNVCMDTYRRHEEKRRLGLLLKRRLAHCSCLAQCGCQRMERRALVRAFRDLAWSWLARFFDERSTKVP
ncbi:hypothetical protein MRX96_029561 [Rhipicephalus microplus]